MALPSQFKLDSPPSFYELFGIKPSLKVDLEALTAKFYSLSMEMHPDRFSGHSTQEQIAATQVTALLNRAYQTLKNPDSRSRYFLELQGKPVSEKSNVPFDLAETYFEIQEAIEDGAPREKLQAFAAELRAMQQASEKEFESIANQLEKEPESATAMSSLTALLDKKRYLQSMLRDLDKKVGF